MLAQVEAQYGSAQTGGIIMDPQDRRNYRARYCAHVRPNDFSHENISSFGNPIAQNQYEFGSIMKPLTMAAGLDAGVIGPDLNL